MAMKLFILYLRLFVLLLLILLSCSFDARQMFSLYMDVFIAQCLCSVVLTPVMG